VIADDKMEGRDTGSRGERAAEEYAVEQLKKAGLEPAGINALPTRPLHVAADRRKRL